MDRLTQIINTFKQRKNMELEVRLRDINYETFADVYAKIVASPDFKYIGITYSVDTLTTIEDNKKSQKKPTYMRRQEFECVDVGGECKLREKSKKFVRKSMLNNYFVNKNFINYSVNLNEELPVDKDMANSNSMTRIKVRQSFTFDNWRVDMTALRRDKISPELRDLVRALFLPYSRENFLDLLDKDKINKYEIELEYLDEKKAEINPANFNSIKSIFALINPDYEGDFNYQNEIYNLAKYISPEYENYREKYGLKKLLSQVITLSRTNYGEIYSARSSGKVYFATEKADGIRAVAHIQGIKCVIIADKLYTYSGEIGGSPSKIHAAMPKQTIIEGELLPTGEFLAFDAMIIDGESLLDLPTSERLAKLSAACEILRRFCECRPKNFVRLEDLECDFRKVYEAKYPYAIDGMIITSGQTKYGETKHYKWKPIEDLTIDFLAMSPPKTLLGVPPFISRAGKHIYILFVGISYQMQSKLKIDFMPQYSKIFPDTRGGSYYPIQFSPSENPRDYIFYDDRGDLSGKIIELRRKNGEWVFNRVRDDRQREKGYYGNDYEVAEKNYRSILNPLNFEDLWNFRQGYFAENAGETYKAGNAARRIIITAAIEKYMRKTHKLLDLAAGNGADIFRYEAADIEQVLCVERDKNALDELNSRRLSMVHNKKVQGKIAIFTMNADLTTPAATLIEQMRNYNFYPGAVDNIVCNFAVHYLCDTAENLANFVKLAATMLAVGGNILITTLNGTAIFNLIARQKKGYEYILREGESAKHIIRKDFDGDKIAAVGQTISVKLPFSSELYAEPLCNVDNLLRLFRAEKFEIVENISFGERMNLVEAENPTLFRKLNDVDLIYNSFHQLIVMRKMK